MCKKKQIRVTAWVFLLTMVMRSHALENEPNVLSLIRESRESLAAGRMEQAVALARRAVEVDPAYADAWKQYGRSRMLIQPDQESLDAMEKSWQLQPDWHSEIPAWKASILLQLDRVDLFQTYIRTMPDEGFNNISRTEIIHWLDLLLGKREDETAILLAGKRAAIDDDSAVMALLKILTESLRSAPGDVSETIPSWVSDSPDSIRLAGMIYHHAGRRALYQDNLTLAQKYFKKAMLLDPENYSAWGDLGWVHLRAGRKDQAIAVWREGIENGAPRKAAWLIWMADAELQSGRLDAALKYAEEAVDTEPSFPPARIMKLFLLMKLGQFDEVASYESSFSGRDDDEFVRLEARIRYARTGKGGRETLDLLQRLFMSGSADESQRRLLFNTLHHIALDADYGDKEFYIESALKYYPDQPVGLNELGWIRWEQGRSQEALALWEKAMSQSSAETHAMLVDVMATLLEEGSKQDALSFFKKINPDPPYLEFGVDLIRRGRPVPAIALLQIAWNEHQDRETCGMYLAYALALNLQCPSAEAYLEPYATADLSPLSDEKIDLLAVTFSLCEKDPDLKLNPVVTSEVTELLMSNAEAMERSGNIRMAYALYLHVLNRDPASAVWLTAVRLAEALDRPVQIDRLLDRALAAPVTPPVHLRLQSIKARRGGKIASAVQYAKESLELEPDQPGLRVDLFDLLMAASRYQEAVEQVMWVEKKYAKGDAARLPDLANMLNRLSRKEETFRIWLDAHDYNPDAVTMAMKAADYLDQICRMEDAATILKSLVVAVKGNTSSYARLGELELGMGRYEAAVEWVDRGLIKAPGPSLYRQRAELAEINFDWPVAYSNAIRFTELDPGYPPMQRLVSRTMIFQQQVEDAVQWNKKLLERNPMSISAHTDIGDAYAKQGNYRQALNHARRFEKQHRGDPEATRRLALAAAEAQSFREAIRTLSPVAGMEINQAIPVIMYRHLSKCDVEGRNSVRQFDEQLRALSDAKYHFITPEMLLAGVPTNELRIMVVVVDPDPEVFSDLHDLMVRYDARAVLAVSVPRFRARLKSTPSSVSWREVLSGRHWTIASSGPENFQRAQISSQGLLGNPLTHRVLLESGEQETLVEMEQRLNEELLKISRDLPGEFPVLIYPQGDYGQLSLDCLTGEVDVLRRVTSNYFKMAIAQGDSGFVVPGFDPWRIPAKVIPAPSFIRSRSIDESADLIDYLQPRNPLLRAKLDMAGLLQRHGQHTRANQWYRDAKEQGADEAAVMYGWGVNSLSQGDLPSALNHLREAREIGSFEQDHILDALDRAELAKVPQLSAGLQGWKDSDDRKHLVLGGDYHGYVREEIRLGGLFDYQTFKQDGLGDESGMRLGADTRWFVGEEQWLSASLWWMNMESGDVSDFPGGSLAYHSGSAWLNGSWELTYERDQVQSVEAVRNEVMSDSGSLQTESIIADLFEVQLNGTAAFRTDNNDTWLLDGRFLYRVLNRPSLGFGYHGQWADSDETTPDYYTPDGLERHAAMAALRGTIRWIDFEVSGDLGTARSSGGSWENVWGVNAEGEIKFTDTLHAFGGYARLEDPGYTVDSFRLGLDIRF